MSANARENQSISDFCKGCGCNNHSYSHGRIDRVDCHGRPGKKNTTITSLLEFIRQNSGKCPYKDTRCLSAAKMDTSVNFKERDLKNALVALNCAACNYRCEDGNHPCSIDNHDPRNMIGMKRREGYCPDHSSRGGKIRP